MVSAGMDSQLKVWDLRNYQLLHALHMVQPAASVSISQRSLVAAVQGSHCSVWTDLLVRPLHKSLLLSHVHCGTAHAAKFCPYEDCLGIGHSRGFSSILVPGWSQYFGRESLRSSSSGKVWPLLNLVNLIYHDMQHWQVFI